MEGFLKQSTAVNVTVSMTLASDGQSGATSKTLTIYASKAAAGPAAITPTVTELDSTNTKGLYKLALTSSHTDTLGELELHVTCSGCVDGDYKWQVSTYLPGEAATLQSSQHVIVDSGTVTTVTNQLTAAQVATGVWQDATAGDFTTSSSIGKSLYTSGVVPGGSGGLFIAGTNAATTITTGLTTTFTGNLTGSVGSVTGLTASNLDATVSSRMATYTQPTGFLAATFPGGTVANTTNITAGTITTTANLTNLPSIPNDWLTAAGIAPAALNGKGDWNIGKTGYSLTSSYDPAKVDPLGVTLPGSYTGQKAGYLIWKTANKP